MYDYTTPIDDLELSVRAYNTLKNAKLRTVGDVVSFVETTNIRSIHSVGRRTAKEIEEIVEEAKRIDRGEGPHFVLVTMPAKGIRDGATWRETSPEARSIIGPFSTWDAAQQWRDTKVTADGATSEILTPETPR